MFKELFISFRDNFREKTTNPFLGTYIIVWIISNWKLVYSLFNFTSDDSLQYRVSFIKQYYKSNPFFENIWCNILWTFGVLVCTYLLLNISRAIVNISEKQIRPQIYKYTSKSEIVLTVHYKNMEAQRDLIQKELDKERQSTSRLETHIRQLKDKKDNNLKVLEENTNSSINEEDRYQNIYKALHSIYEEDYIRIFKTTAVKIKKREYFKMNNIAIDKFIEYGLIKFLLHNDITNENQYVMTKEGDAFLNYLNHPK